MATKEQLARRLIHPAKCPPLTKPQLQVILARFHDLPLLPWRLSTDGSFVLDANHRPILELSDHTEREALVDFLLKAPEELRRAIFELQHLRGDR